VAENDKKALYQFRAEDFDKNYYSLREIEWRRSLETISGYVGIAIAHYNLNTPERMQGNPFLFYAGIYLPLLLFVIYAIFSLCIQARLHYTRDLKNNYIDKLHLEYGESKLPKESKPPRFGNWYAFVTQLVIHAAVVTAIITYVCKAAWS
jgi:hypothetical protein